MLRHSGRVAFFGAAASWAILALTLAMSGLGPAASRTRLLQALATGAIVCAVVASMLAIVALVRGPQRGSAAVGLLLGVLFLLAFTSAGFGLLR